MNTKKIGSILFIFLLLTLLFVIPSKPVEAVAPTAQEMAYAILTESNQSALQSAVYSDGDSPAHRQAIILTNFGTITPSDGPDFLLLSTGIAGANPVMTESGIDGYHSERGKWFGAQHPSSSGPFDHATLTLTLEVPEHMHFLYYDVQFFTTEFPDYDDPTTTYNDKLTVTVASPHYGTSIYTKQVKDGDFVLTADDIPGTGFDIFAKTSSSPHVPTNPADVDWIDQVPGVYQGTTCADAGASAPVGRQHPVWPNEIITVTFDIKDAGDNQFDSAALIDNMKFSGYARVEILARKTVQDVNGGVVMPGDTLEYTVTVSNIGTAPQYNNQGHEFEDLIPLNTQYVPDSTSTTSGTVTYDAGTKKIYWDGGIPVQSSIALSFRVTVNAGLFNGTIISNQGTVQWDSNEDNVSDANELTDDPNVPGDHNPTNVTVWSSAIPTTLTEDFSDDIPGEKATESYEGHIWFNTSSISQESNFEVSQSYYYYTSVLAPRSFKTKLRAINSPQYWNYSLAQFNKNIKWWEIYFTCGNTSEEADLVLNFTTSTGTNLVQLKFDYMHAGSVPPSDYVCQLSYKSSTNWIQLHSDYSGGYLFNGWYKLRIEPNGASALNYSLSRVGVGQTDLKTDSILNPSYAFSNLVRIEWRSTKNPVVCPMLFWDEHTIGLNT
jgi:uncharacterized repeat protein (TIGR01451 family)